MRLTLVISSLMIALSQCYLVPLANFVITFPVFMSDCDKDSARITSVF